MKISDLHNMISSEYKERFVHCHQSFIVNIEKVVEINKNTVSLEGGVELPISRKYKKELVDKFVIKIGGYL